MAWFMERRSRRDKPIPRLNIRRQFTFIYQPSAGSHLRFSTTRDAHRIAPSDVPLEGPTFPHMGVLDTACAGSGRGVLMGMLSRGVPARPVWAC